MNTMNEFRWGGRLYRHAAGDDGGDAGGGAADGGGDDGGGDDGGGAAASGDQGAGDTGGGDGGDDGGGDGGAGGQSDDWRARYAAYAPEGDERTAAEKLIGRFTNEEDFVNGAIQAHAKLRAGELNSDTKPEDADKLKEWREARGIPEDAKYQLEMSQGVELSEVDLQMLEPVFAFAYEQDVSNEVLNGLIDKYMVGREDLLNKMNEQDNLDAQGFNETMKLQENWGKDFKVNMNRIVNRMNHLPEAVRDLVKQARLPDGKQLMNSPEYMNWLVGMDREIMPMDPIPGGGEADTTTAQQVIDKVKKIFAENREGSDYWGPSNAGLRQEYQNALALVDKMQGSQ